MTASRPARVRLLGAALVGVLAGTTGDLGANAAVPTGPRMITPVISAPAATVPGSPASAGGTSAGTARPTLSIVSISPQLPVPILATQKLTITVRIGNPTIATVDHLELQVNRGDPITSEAGVAAAIANPPAATDLDIAAVKVAGVITPQGSRTVALTVLAGFDPATGLCLGCGTGNGVYPVDVSLRSTTAGAELARAHTLVPAFAATPQPVRVSWLWPLIDRPHRSTSDSVFDDDALAGSVSAGGRLDRALRVAELVKGKIRLTLVVDPELIDALGVMVRGYTVRTKATPRPGTGGAAAAAWLARLRAVAGYDDVSLTGYADPDVDALVRAGVEYSTALAPQVSRRVAAVLGGHLTSDVAWPPGENLTSGGLDAVVASGATSVLLSDAALPGASGWTSTPDALSTLPAATGTDDALVLNSALQRTVLAATGVRGTVGDARRLVAQLAVRAVARPSVAHFAVLAPARYVDPNAAMAAGAMLAVAGAPWAQDISVRSAVSSLTPVDLGALAPAGASAEVSAKQIATMITARNQVAAFRDCLTNQSAPTLLGGFAGGLARATSASWRAHRAAGRTFAAALLGQIVRLESKVSIQVPAGAHYTLASNDAPLEVTVRNDLSVDVRVKVRITALDGQTGFRAEEVPVQRIAGGAQQQIKVKTHVDRAGHFRIRVILVTPHDLALHRWRTITVNSTALGVVALWITGIALGILVLALAVRVGRRIARRGRSEPGRPEPGRSEPGRSEPGLPTSGRSRSGASSGPSGPTSPRGGGTSASGSTAAAPGEPRPTANPGLSQ